MGLKNCYSILTIPENSSEEDIKRAYRKLAVRFHPDKNLGKTDGSFNDIQEAYDILIDPIKRSDHDKKLGLIKIKSPARNRHGTDINVSLKIKVTDIANESTFNISTTQQVHCPDCNGTGCTSKTLTFCNNCNGTGIDLVSAIMGPKKFCGICKGYGNYQETPNCKSCKGLGLILTGINRQIKVSRDFQPTIIIPKSGNFAIGNSVPGNLNVTLVIEKTSNYEVVGKDIKGHLKISPAQAILGDIIFIDVFGDPVKIIIPEGIKHGEILEKEHAGVTKNNKKGSLLLKINIDIPKKISDEEKKLYTQLLKIQKGFL